MAASPGRTRCVTCGKEKATLKCGGCLQDFCYNHSTEHRNELSKQLDEVEITRDIFRQTLTEQTTKSEKHALVQKIDKWERDSIIKIQQTADEARQMLLKHTTGHIAQIETKLSRLTDQLRQSREENDFFETDLRQWKEELARLTQQLTKTSEITIQQGSTPLVAKIHVAVSSDKSVPLYVPNNIDPDAGWTQNSITVAGGNGRGNRLNQLNIPFGIFVDDDQTIFIADYDNHRIVEWKYGAAQGQVIAGGNGRGNRLDQLCGPTDVIVDKKSDSLIICDCENRRVVRWPLQNGTNGQTIISDVDCCGLAMDNEGYLYISNYMKHEVRRWRIGDTNGTIVAGGHGKGTRLNQLNTPTYIFVDRDQSVYVSDWANHRVMKWMKSAKEGIVVAGDRRQGNSLVQLSKPNGIFVDELGTVYVADFGNNRVMRWIKGARQGSIVVGSYAVEEQSNQLDHPIGLSFDRKGNLYVSDSDNNRVQKFNIDSTSNLY